MGNVIPAIPFVAQGQMLPLLIFVMCVVTFALATILTRARRVRAIPGMTLLRSSISRAIESRGRIHLGLGSGGIGGKSTLETTAGLTLLQHLAQQSALCDVPITVSVADPTTLAAAQGILRDATARSPKNSQLTLPDSVQFIAPEPLAYASGAAMLIEHEKPAFEMLVGTYGLEYLLIGETARRLEGLHVAGTTNAEALSLMQATADAALIGEEVFAIGAYLGRPAHQGSLLTDDILRVVTAVLTIAGIVLYSLRF